MENNNPMFYPSNNGMNMNFDPNNPLFMMMPNNQFGMGYPMNMMGGQQGGQGIYFIFKKQTCACLINLEWV